MEDKASATFSNDCWINFCNCGTDLKAMVSSFVSQHPADIGCKADGDNICAFDTKCYKSKFDEAIANFVATNDPAYTAANNLGLDANLTQYQPGGSDFVVHLPSQNQECRNWLLRVYSAAGGFTAEDMLQAHSFRLTTAFPQTNTPIANKGQFAARARAGELWEVGKGPFNWSMKHLQAIR